MKRSGRLVAAALAVLLLSTALVAYESLRIVVEHVEVPVAGLPAAFDGFRIVQVTDLHGRRLDPAGAVVVAAAAARPDIIVATGDFVSERPSEVHNVTPLLSALTRIAPVYAVSGNHDHWADWPQIAREVEACGVTLLENRHTILARGSDRLVLAGVGDPYTGHADLGAALPPRAPETGLAGDEALPPPVVLLVHSPLWFEAKAHGSRAYEGAAESAYADPKAIGAALDRVALALAGHTHGGQIRLPVIGALSNASGRFLPRDYVSGLSLEGNTWLYISRGLGFSILPVRFLAPAEVTVITLRRAARPPAMETYLLSDHVLGQ